MTPKDACDIICDGTQSQTCSNKVGGHNSIICQQHLMTLNSQYIIYVAKLVISLSPPYAFNGRSYVTDLNSDDLHEQSKIDIQNENNIFAKFNSLSPPAPAQSRESCLGCSPSALPHPTRPARDKIISIALLVFGSEKHCLF